MGVVYMAEQEEPVRRRVALKIIKLGMDTKQVVARFEAERQALALMDHPNIARVLDGGATETGRPYFVMELVQGVPITEFCDKNHLPARERINLFIPVCQAVQSAQQKGIIHRDLKPSNILVTLNGGLPVPKVIDFGVAKATNQKLTEKTLFTNYATMIGTPAYMSPEQAEMSSLDVDTRTDIYSLGVLLYELLTGTTPFSEEHLRSVGYGEMQRIIAEEEPDQPSTRLSTIQGEQRTAIARKRGPDGPVSRDVFASDLDWIVMKCLEKDRARRYETANGLALDIQRHLNNKPILARPPSPTYRFQKFARRNKVVFASAAVVCSLLGTIALAAVGLWSQNGAALSVTPISQGQLPSGQTIVTLLITLDPGDTVPWHLHTGPGWGTVVSGILTQEEGCGNPQTQVSAGSAFAEIPGHVHRVFNFGQVPAVFAWTEIFPTCDPNAGGVFVSGPDCEGTSGRSHLESVTTCP